MEIGKRIADLREWKSESQQQLADAIGVKRETVKFWESGDRQIKGRDIIKLSKHFGVSADYILEMSEVRSIGDEAQAACKVTGLSETVVERLSECADTKIINSLMEQSSFWTAIARLSALSYAVSELRSMYERIQEGVGDSMSSKRLLDLCKEIRMQRFEASDSMDSALDRASSYFEYSEILRSIERLGADDDGKR